MTADPKEQDPSYWGLSIRQLQALHDDIKNDMASYCQEHSLLSDFTHMCHAGKDCRHRHEKIKYTPQSRESPEEANKATPIAGNMHIVVQKYIKPQTEPHRCSYAAMKNRGQLKKAKNFISHSWGERFGDFVASIGKKLDEDEVAWICSCALAQNEDITAQLGDRLEDSPFAKALAKADTVWLMVDAKDGALYLSNAGLDKLRARLTESLGGAV
eukprot:CAMPEP_0170348990 /NCGR_PEP_ID=MMETSP0116_2-20130129/75779_1 /TAXON_ID=400756 /ORGANISM="Durinskia baltica, Strain CSIRO CS-38" /LENGTH=213 /DNA_ID=CAMNT_0010602861 /DNA_START=39 /DNA_END=677 /DNA_ORIENTATION=-